MAKLSVNVDHVATLRQTRKTYEPDPVAAAILAELAGADGIIVHLREDRRHIQERDIRILRETVSTKLNQEMAATDEMIKIALNLKPDLVTLVPERRAELTTEGGLDLIGNINQLEKVISVLHEGDLKVSVFIDPESEQIRTAARLHADVIELHTGVYANAVNPSQKEHELERIKRAAELAKELNLEVSAGHGLTYINVKPVAAIPEIEEFSIGHSIVARAVLVGFERAVKEMIELVR